MCLCIIRSMLQCFKRVFIYSEQNWLIWFCSNRHHGRFTKKIGFGVPPKMYLTNDISSISWVQRFENIKFHAHHFGIESLFFAIGWIWTGLQKKNVDNIFHVRVFFSFSNASNRILSFEIWINSICGHMFDCMDDF